MSTIMADSAPRIAGEQSSPSPFVRRSTVATAARVRKYTIWRWGRGAVASVAIHMLLAAALARVSFRDPFRFPRRELPLTMAPAVEEIEVREFTQIVLADADSPDDMAASAADRNQDSLVALRVPDVEVFLPKGQLETATVPTEPVLFHESVLASVTFLKTPLGVDQGFTELAPDVDEGSENVVSGTLEDDAPQVGTVEGAIGSIGDGSTTYVYVMDCSSRMRGEKWAAARRELTEALRGIGPESHFYVILFNSESQRMFNRHSPEPEPVPATPANLRRVETWLNRVALQGDARVERGLVHALQIKCAGLFLISGGQFSDSALSFVRSNQGAERRTAIHAIGVGEGSRRGFLEQISRTSGGTFRVAD